MAFRLDPTVTAGQFVQLRSGLRLHYACAGEPGAPLVVLLHGFPEFWFAWHDMMSLLKGKYFFVAPDMRGYNQSDKPVGVNAYQINHLTNDVVELVEALGYQNCRLIAHDWGGAVAWAVAIGKPELLESLMILNAPHPVPFARMLAEDGEQQQASRYMNMLRGANSESQLLANNCALLLDKFRVPGLDDWLTPQVASQYRAAWTVPGAMTGMVNYYRASPLYPPQGNESGAAGLALNPQDFKVTVPTHVVWGMGDTALLPGLLLGLDEQVDSLTITRVEQASHWLIHERPDLVSQIINEFLSA